MTMPQTTGISPNIQYIRQHLEVLFADLSRTHPDGMIEISTLTASEYFKVTDIEAASQYAFDVNKKGTNVYTTPALLCPNVTDKVKERDELEQKSTRARAEDFYACGAAWIDVDEMLQADKDKLQDKYKDTPPNYYAVTNRTGDTMGVHLYWQLSEPILDKQELVTINKGLLENIGGDKSAWNPTRLMKLGGSIAWPKKKGRTAQLVAGQKTSYRPRHSVDSLKSAYPYEQGASLNLNTQINTNHSSLNLNNNEWSQDEISTMLDYIDPDADYLDWLSVGMALKDYNMPFHMFDAWSSKGSKYPGSNELLKKWDSFKGTGTTIGTLYYHAHSRGYKPARQSNDSYKQAQEIVTEYKYEHPQRQEPPPHPIEIVDDTTGEISEIRRLPMVYASDITPVLDTNDFIEDLLCTNEFSVIYGESNCGKTFFMLDIAMRVALGLQWRDKKVDQGGVIYAALEGGHGTKNRIAAFKKEHNIEGDIPLAIIPSSLNFLDTQGDIKALVHAIDEASQKMGGIKLIVIDTLSRAISGGDENSSMDMGAMIINADAIRAITGAHISFIHHSGKDNAKGARGHSSLRAAVDTEIEISREDEHAPSKIRVVKQREMEMIDDMYFKLERVILGKNQRGKEVASCIVTETEAFTSKVVRMTPAQSFMYECLVDAIIAKGAVRRPQKDMDEVKCVSYDELGQLLEDRGFKEFIESETKSTAQQVKSVTNSTRLALKKMGKVNFNGKYIWTVE